MANDQFANIADSYSVNLARGLVEPQPEKLTDVRIPLVPGNGDAFIPTKKMKNKKEMETALKQLRAQYQPFLQNHAPALEETVVRTELKQFSWSLDGAPAQTVTVPHYGAKTGRHRAVYETVFSLPPFDPQKNRVMLVFRGVDYLAEVFLNSEFVGRHEGFFAPFELDVTECVRQNSNQLRVVVKNDFTMTGNSCAEGLSADGDKIYAATGPGWDDPEEGWHHCPAGMGIYQKVFVELRPNETVTDLFVRDGRELWIECMGTDIQGKSVIFDVSLYGQNFKETVFEHLRQEPMTRIEAGVGDTLTEAQLIAEGKLHQGTPLLLGSGYNRFCLPLNIPNLRIWSPEEPNLYQVQVRLLIDGRVVSTKARQFGVRTFTQDMKSDPKGIFLLNGKKLRLRGANTMGFEQQCVMNGQFDRLLNDLLLAKLCNMNFLRLTQRPVQEEIYEMCDKIGLMIQTDFPIFGTVRINQMAEVIRQAGEMEHLVRSHPCCILDTYINEPFPNASNKPHRMLCRMDLEALFTAADAMVHLHNPERVIKHVDGDYDPPCDSMPDNHCYTMWYNGHGIDFGKLHKGYWLAVKPGWFWGCGEFGAEGLDFPDLMRKSYPKEWIREPFDPKHIKRAQTGDFYYFFYDTPETMEKWCAESQQYQAFATQMMTNAFRRSNGMVSFAIHLFIDAWPSGWMKSIMDCQRAPKPAWFTYRDCLSPLKADLRCDRFAWFGGETMRVECRICNDGAPVDGAELALMAVIDGKTVATASRSAVIGDCCTEYQGMAELLLPEVSSRSVVELYLAVIKNSQILHWTKENFSVFPRKKYRIPEAVTYSDYEQRKVEIDRRLAAGRTVIFAPLQPGSYSIAGQKVQVKACGMHPVYFVSGKTASPLTRGFQNGDFAYWYDPQLDCIAPILDATLEAENAEMVLTSGNKDCDGNWKRTGACQILHIGRGKIVLCQIDLNRFSMNPVCAEFAERLVRMQSYDRPFLMEPF